MADSGIFPDDPAQNELSLQADPLDYDVNAKDNLGNTELHRAINMGNLEDVTKLLAQPGIDVNIRNGLEETPVIMAAKRPLSHREPQILAALLEQPGVDVNALERPKRETALHHAIKNDQLQLINILLDHENTDSSLRNTDGETAFTLLLSRPLKDWGMQVLDRFLAHPQLKVNESNKWGTTPLMLAVQSHTAPVVDKLLKHPDIQVNEQDMNGYTALIHQVVHRSPKLDSLNLLLNRPDLDVNLMYQGSEFALLKCNHYESLERLLKHEALNLHQLDKHKMSKFRSVICRITHNKNDERIANLISQHPRFEVNATRADGDTDLVWAIRNKKDDVVRYLLDYPDINVSPGQLNGPSSLMLLAEWFNTGLMKALITHRTFDEVDFNRQDKDGKTFLHHLFGERVLGRQAVDTQFLASLIDEREIDLSIADTRGYTALMCSIVFASKNQIRGLEDIILSMLQKSKPQDIIRKNRYNLTVLDLVKEYADNLDPAIKGVFRDHMPEQIQQEYHSNLSVAQQLSFLRRSLPGLKMPQQATDYLIQQVDKLESDIDVFTCGRYGNELGMLEVHRDKLQGLHVQMLQNLEVRCVLASLFADGIITQDQKEEIEGQQFRARMVTRLLSILPTRGPDAYNAFIKSLRESDQEYIAEALEAFDPTQKKTSGSAVSTNYGPGTVSMVTGSAEQAVALNVAPGREMSFTFVVRAEQQ